MKLPEPKKLPSGSWNAVVMIHGTRYSVTAPTKKECIQKLSDLKTGQAEGRTRADRVTLGQAVDDYINSKREVLSPSTIRGYAAIRRNRLQSLMERDIYALTPQMLQKAVNEDLRDHSVKSTTNVLGLIRPALAAYKVDLGEINLPQRVRPVKKYLQPEDIGKLIQQIQEDPCEVPILLAVWLGLRRSEIAGLCWDMVDLEKSVIHVRRALVPDEHNQWILKDCPKTAVSQRTIDCPEYIMDLIRRMPHTDERLFHFHPETISKHVHAACKAAGITDTSIHGLRHTNAAVMKSLGVDDRLAMERGGWSSESTYKKTYSYVFNSKRTEADEKIDSFFTNEITNEK